MFKKIVSLFSRSRNSEREQMVNAMTSLWDAMREQQREINALREGQQRLELLNNPWTYWPAGDNQ
jgi:hypothetical protein